MPFDALMMRAIEVRWKDWLVGRTVVRVQCGRDRLLWTVKGSDRQSEQMLWVLQPGLQRLHRTSRVNLPARTPTPPWLQKIVPFTVTDLTVPELERVMTLEILIPDEWDQPSEARLVVELAGHLTNLVLVGTNNLVIDAWRKIGPGRPGRTVWPRLPYALPPRPVDAKSVWPPWAERWINEGGDRNRLQQDWSRGFPGPAAILHTQTADDVWVYPMAGLEAKSEDLERALDQVYDQRERRRLEEALRAQLSAQIKSRLAHVGEKVSQYTTARHEDESRWKMIGDLWLTYQSQFQADPSLTELTVEGFDGKPVALVRDENLSPADQARSAYRRYKKIRARKEALARLIPVFQREQEELEALYQDVRSAPHPPEWYRNQLKKNGRASKDNGEREPFRRFKSLTGLEILVGRNRDENARLTFQKARPDDIWLHTKQAPGSHVILGSGKTNPTLDDLLDAAELAVFFSTAAQSSTVPVDYTRRKFVRKRPHAEPGQVLYQREKTLYITPDLDRLRRLGAVSEKLVDDSR